MRIGFRHCLLSSCLFRCGAGWLRRDGRAVCGRRSRCLGGRRSSRAGGDSPSLQRPGLPRSLPDAFLLFHQRHHRRCPRRRHRAPHHGSGAGMARAPPRPRRLLPACSAKAGNRARRRKTALLAPQETSPPRLRRPRQLPQPLHLWRLRMRRLESASPPGAASAASAQRSFLQTAMASSCVRAG